MKKTFFASIAIIFSITIVCQAEFQVNTYTKHNQECPAVAMSPQGDFVVVWLSNPLDGRGGGIYGQRFNAEGNKVGSEFKINTSKQFPIVDWWPSVAMNSFGGFVVVWAKDRNLGGWLDADVVARVYNSEGIPLTGEILVNTNTFDAQWITSVAINSSGSFVVVWQNWDAIPIIPHYDINGRLFDAAGTPQGDEFIIAELPDGSPAHNPDVVMDEIGNFVVTWYRDSGSDIFPPRGQYIQLRRYNADGSPKGDIVQITDDIKVAAPTYAGPSIAMDCGGNFAIAWAVQFGSYDYDVYAQRFDTNAVPIGDPFLVNTHTDETQGHPSISMNGQGQFIIVWQSKYQDGSNYGVFGQKYSKSGVPIGDEFQLNTYTSGKQWYPDIAMSQNGKFVTVWESEGGQDGSGYGIFGEFGQFPQPKWKDLTDYSYELVWQKRLSRTEFEYCFRMRARNLGTEPIENITVDLASAPSNITVLNSKVFFGLIPVSGEVLSDDTFVVKIDHSSPADENDIIWEISNEMEGDFSGDNQINFVDFAYLADKWLQTGAGMPEDLYKNEIIDFEDLAMFAENWLEGRQNRESENQGRGQEDFGLRIADLRLMEIATAFGLAMTGPEANQGGMVVLFQPSKS